MTTTPTLINVRHLLRKKVILADGVMRQSGFISQIFLHPSKGKLRGFELRLEGKAVPLLVAINYLLFNATPAGNEQIAGLTDSFTLVEAFEDGATTYQEFLDTEIITDDGNRCGRVKEVYFGREGLQTVYQIMAAGWRGLFRKSYFIKGSKNNYYSYRHRRLVLPVETPRFSSLTAVQEYLQLSPAITFLDDRTQSFSRIK